MKRIFALAAVVALAACGNGTGTSGLTGTYPLHRKATMLIGLH